MFSMEIECITFYISCRLPKGFKNPTYYPVEQDIIANVFILRKS